MNKIISRIMFQIVLCITVAACGGGGSDAKPDLVIESLTPNSVQRVYNSGDRGQLLTFDVTYSGKPSSTLLYIVVEDEDQIVKSGEVSLGTVGKAQLTLTLKDPLPVGTFQKPLTLHACKDSKCTAEYGGSPFKITKHIEVKGTTVDKTSLAFSASPAGTVGEQQNITVATPNGENISYFFKNYEYTAPGATSPTGFMSDIFSVTQNATGISVSLTGKSYPGSYKVQLVIHTENSNYADVPVDITYDAGPIKDHGLILNTPSLAITAPVQYVSASTPLYVSYKYAHPFVVISLTSIEFEPSTPLTEGYYLPSWLSVGTQSINSDGSYSRQFLVDPCRVGCISAGVYKAKIILTTVTGSITDRYEIPVTLTIK